MVWSHSPVVELLGVTCKACEPLCTGLLTTVSPDWQLQPESEPASKPGLLTRLPPEGVGVGVVPPVVGVGVGVLVLVAVGVGVGVPPPLLPELNGFQRLVNWYRLCETPLQVSEALVEPAQLPLSRGTSQKA